MADLVLNDVLNSKITVNNVVSWLTTDNTDDKQWAEINDAGCTQGEFVLYFLNFLRDQTTSALQAPNNARQTPAKPTLSRVSSVDDTYDKAERPHRRASLFGPPESQIPECKNTLHGIRSTEDLETQAVNESPASLGDAALPEAGNVGTGKKIASSSASKRIECSSFVTSQDVGDNQDSSNVGLGGGKSNSDLEKNFSTIFGTYPDTTTSTPLTKKKVPLTRVPRTGNDLNFSIGVNKSDTNHDNMLCSRRQDEIQLDPLDRSLLSKTEWESSLNDSIDKSNGNFSFNATDNVSSKDTSSVLNHLSKNDNRDQSSLLSKHSSKNEFSESSLWNSSLRSKNSAKNESSLHSINEFQQCPISPLYCNNMMTTTTPLNHRKSYSRSAEKSLSSNNSCRQSVIATPKQGTNSVQRNLKSTPRQNVSLADFITVDTRSSKKGSAKKCNAKAQLLRNSDQVANKLSVTDESFPEVGKNSARRRRIKPTRLDVSGETGCKESATFGVIIRPPIVNPIFSETSPTDKSVDKISFEAERDLLRLERQKQKKVSLSTESDECSTQSLLLKTPSKQKLYGPTVTPDLSLIEHKEALILLASLYSGLLDYNLVLNPMTELCFVLSLINLQQPKVQHLVFNESGSQRRYNDKFVNKAADVKSDGKPGNLSNHDEPTNLDNFNEDLGCAMLSKEIDSKIDEPISLADDNQAQMRRTKRNFERLSLKHESYNCTNIQLEQQIVYSIEMEYFQTIHNCVYFSTLILNNQRALLKLLNRATLKLLCENNRIAAFLPELQEYLNELYKMKLNESGRMEQQYNIFSAAETNVCFQIDTDNRENFPSLNAFQSFRKQRDLFYEVLRIWEHYHLVKGWAFENALGGKIRTLLTLHNDATNYFHFARLFKSQLLISCIGNGPQEDPMDDESLSFLKSLKHLNAEKLTRLRERLVKPLSARGPVPPPSFLGVQEFYKDFILHASNSMFYAHLQDCLVHEIMELNDTQFTGSEIEDTETMVDEETKQNFITCVSSLRLLAKVLSFLISLPYRCQINSLENVMASQIELRSRVQPPLNLESCLRKAIVEGKLSLTIPWAVKFLAMLDPVSLRLPYYKAIMELLFHIYRQSCHCISKFDTPQALQSAVLVKFSLGWLFELPIFPEGSYLNWLWNQSNGKLRAICYIGDQSLRSTDAASMEAKTLANSSIKSRPCLDTLDIIDDRALYVCCPFLTELKILLTTDNSSLSNNNSIRHITPVSSGLDRSIGGTGTKQLELQLEEAFFHGQPASTRKTVDFVSERVASTCVKHVCNSMLPSAREKNASIFKNIVTEKTLPDDSTKYKSLMLKEMHLIGSKVAAELRVQCAIDIPLICKSRTVHSMESLLAEDTLASVKEMCAQIAIRMATERINHWIQSHIVGSLFVKDMEAEIDKAYRSKNTVKGFEKREHNAEAASPTDVIVELRSIIWELLDNKGQSLTIENVLLTLDKLYQSLTEREDLLAGPERVLCFMSVDFALFLAAHRTDLFVAESQEKFIKIWKIKYLNFSERDSFLSRILSPRNVMLLAQPGNQTVWFSLGQFLRKMLKQGVLSIEALGDQCTALFRHEWPVSILKRLSSCVMEGIKDYESSSEEAEKIKLLLQWISETCNEMELD